MECVSGTCWTTTNRGLRITTTTTCLCPWLLPLLTRNEESDPSHTRVMILSLKNEGTRVILRPSQKALRYSTCAHTGKGSVMREEREVERLVPSHRPCGNPRGVL